MIKMVQTQTQSGGAYIQPFSSKSSSKHLSQLLKVHMKKKSLKILNIVFFSLQQAKTKQPKTKSRSSRFAKTAPVYFLVVSVQLKLRVPIYQAD